MGTTADGDGRGDNTQPKMEVIVLVSQTKCSRIILSCPVLSSLRLRLPRALCGRPVSRFCVSMSCRIGPSRACIRPPQYVVVSSIGLDSAYAYGHSPPLADGHVCTAPPGQFKEERKTLSCSPRALI